MTVVGERSAKEHAEISAEERGGYSQPESSIPANNSEDEINMSHMLAPKKKDTPKNEHRDNTPAKSTSSRPTRCTPSSSKSSKSKRKAGSKDEKRASSPVKKVKSDNESSATKTHCSSPCLVKNLKWKVVAVGRINREGVLFGESYIIVLDNVNEPEYLYDRDEKGDARICDLITWPKVFVDKI